MKSNNRNAIDHLLKESYLPSKPETFPDLHVEIVPCSLLRLCDCTSRANLVSVALSGTKITRASYLERNQYHDSSLDLLLTSVTTIHIHFNHDWPGFHWRTCPPLDNTQLRCAARLLLGKSTHLLEQRQCLVAFMFNMSHAYKPSDAVRRQLMTGKDSRASIRIFFFPI